MEIKIEASLFRGLHTDGNEILISGLQASAKITLLFHYHMDVVNDFVACGNYIADTDGKISTAKSKSCGGTYTG